MLQWKIPILIVFSNIHLVNVTMIIQLNDYQCNNSIFWIRMSIKKVHYIILSSQK